MARHRPGNDHDRFLRAVHRNRRPAADHRWALPDVRVFALYDGRTLLAKVDTGTASTLARVLSSHTYATSGTHTFTIRPLGTAGRPSVYLDGFAMRR